MIYTIPDLSGSFDPNYPGKTQYGQIVVYHSTADGSLKAATNLKGFMGSLSGKFTLTQAQFNALNITGPQSIILSEYVPNALNSIEIKVRDRFIDLSYGLGVEKIEVNGIPTGWKLGSAIPFSLKPNFPSTDQVVAGSQQIDFVNADTGEVKGLKFTRSNENHNIKIEWVNTAGNSVNWGWDFNTLILNEILRRHNQADLDTFKAAVNSDTRELQKKIDSISSISTTMFVSR